MKGAHLLKELEKPLQRGRKKATNESNAMMVDVDDDDEDAQEVTTIGKKDKIKDERENKLIKDLRSKN